MKKLLLLALLWPALVMAQTPSYPVRLDLQSPSRTFALKWAAGSSPLLSAYVSDGGRAYTNLTGWTGYVYVAVTPTAGVYVAASPVGSNRVNFSFLASQTATVGTFGVEVVLSNGTNTYRWGTGSLALSNSPALLGAGTVPLMGVFNWDLYTFTGTQPPLSASYTNPLAGDVTGVPGATVIGDGVVSTGKLSAEVRGLLATGSGINTNSTAWTGLVAQVDGKLSTTGGTLTGTASVNGGSLVTKNNAGGNAHVTIIKSPLASGDPSWSTNEYTIASTGRARFYHRSVPEEYMTATRYGLEIDHQQTATANRSPVLRFRDYNHQLDSLVDEDTLTYTNGTMRWSGVFAFDLQPIIPGYLQTTGTYNLALGTNAPAAWTNGGNSATLGGYLPSDFVLLTTLSTGGYLRITSGAVTSNSMPGTRGEYRRSTTNAYFHDGSQWVTWSVSTNFSH